MKRFIGTKIINAKPMILGDYNELQDIQQENNGVKFLIKGYLVEYTYPDGGLPNHKDFKGYISWSPKEVFDRAYKASGDLSFGDALAYMKLGYKVARKGWNGKGMFLELQVPDEHSKMTVPYPYFTIAGCEEGTRRIPYASTIIDIMSEDWEVL